MLYLLVPWTATNLVDFFLVRHGRYAIADLFTPNGLYGAWGWRGLTAYALGFAAEIPFMVLPGIAGFKYTGPVATHISGVDISWIVGLAVSGTAYWLLSRSLNVRAEAGAIRASDEALEGTT
jgi:nucleobase:cation symporter-1, NCS1 family